MENAMKIKLLLFLVFALNVFGQNKSFINKDDSYFRVGNQFIEETIPIGEYSPNESEIVNKISGRSYTVNSNKFSLEIVFAGFGPALGKNQNGENPSSISAKNFHFNNYKVVNDQGDSKTLILQYSLKDYLYSFYLNVFYKVHDNEPYIRKWIELCDSSEGIHFLDRLNVEDLEFDNPSFSHGEFGQPLFNKDIFLAVEYPAVENIIDGNHVKIGYVVGEKITKNKIISFPSIIGAAPSAEKLEHSFMSYVDSIKVKGTRPFLLYNSWYDLRNPAIAEGPESIMNEKNVLKRIEEFKKYMVEKHNINLDAFVLDDGWDNYNSVWDIDTGHLPNKFTPFLKPLKEIHTALGIWASPFCGYSNRNLRVKWGSEHGYEKTGDFLCFAGKKYKAEFEKKMVEYTKEFNMGYFKWDGFLLACNEPDHGHLPGVYSREALINTYMHMMNAVRKVNPDIFINITVGSWLSPWWLQYADCIWMQGEDYAYAEDVPSTNPREKSITYRDAVLWDNFQNQKLLFPMSSLMTHGIIKGRLNFLGGKNEALDSFTNEVMMYFGRGVMMWELYISPDLLSDGEWDAISYSLKWAKHNKDVLSRTKMILGDPLKREPYGYVHLTKEKGIILLRNPYVDEKQIKFTIDQTLGEMAEGEEYYVKIVYPYKKILAEKFVYPGDFKFDLGSYEIVMLELIPAYLIEPNTPIGVRYDTNKDGQIVLYDSFGSKMNYSLLPHSEIKSKVMDGEISSISIQDVESIKTEQSDLNGKISVSIPYNYNNSKLAFLIEPEERLLKDKAPVLELTNNGNIGQPTVEQENGKWFWISTPIQPGENEIQFKLRFKDKVNSKISLWVFSDEILEAYLLNDKLDLSSEISPPKPYASEVKKVALRVKNFIIQ
jgi:hypothetical protein